MNVYLMTSFIDIDLIVNKPGFHKALLSKFKKDVKFWHLKR